MDKVIKLEHAIPVPTTEGGTVQCNEITIGRLKTKHLKLFPKGFAKMASKGELEPTALIPVIAGLSGLPEESVDEIDIDDLFKIVDQISDFLESTQATTGGS